MLSGPGDSDILTVTNTQPTLGPDQTVSGGQGVC